MRAPMRVAHVISHPIQYMVPLYREIAKRPEVDLTVYFRSDATFGTYHDAGFSREVAWDLDLTSGYRWVLPPSARGAGLGGAQRRLQPDLVRMIMAGRYDAVWLHGYAHLSHWAIAAAATTRGARVLLREEQVVAGDRPLHRRVLKELPLRLLFARVDALYIGEANRQFFIRYGVPAHRLFRARYSVDNTDLQRRREELLPERKALRAALGVHDDRPIVLFAGKLAEHKQPELLLDAWRRTHAKRPSHLVFVGDGPLRERLAGISGVTVTGFLNQSELPRVYAAADVFCLPSRKEPWGLVVNEALNFALPVVVSDRVGCASDLVRDAWNGYVAPHDNPQALSDALDALIRDEALRCLFGERGRATVDAYSVHATADDIVAACLAPYTTTEPAGALI